MLNLARSWPAALLLSLSLLASAPNARVRAESRRRTQLRTDEAETPEPLTDKPLKHVMQNLFLQEDPFPQQHLQLQTTARAQALALTQDPSVVMNLGAELGLADSWTVSVHAPLGLFPGDERGLGNVDLGALYCLWVNSTEDLRLTATLRNVLPSPSGAGANAFGHDLSVIGYARAAPFHFQAVATLDVSYGQDIASSPRLRPEAALAAILRLKDVAFVAEGAVQRELTELRYLSALGVFAYPGQLELGLAAILDLTETPVSLGASAIFSYALDPPS